MKQKKFIRNRTHIVEQKFKMNNIYKVIIYKKNLENFEKFRYIAYFLFIFIHAKDIFGGDFIYLKNHYSCMWVVDINTTYEN